MDKWSRVIRTCQLWYLLLMQFTEMWNVTCASETRVVAKAPVSPVVEGEILSVHCQVWNLQKGQEVTFIRTPEDGEQTRIAFIVDGEPLIVSNSGGTVFVAVRQMHDGSIVYFLSILNAAKSDAGDYACKIDAVGSNDDLPEDSVDIKIAYFPSESGPSCTPGELTRSYTAGDDIILQCTSENAYPEVNIEWTRSGSSQILPSEKLTLDDNRTGALLRRTLTEQDSGKIFLCQVSSRSFASRTASCHIGPIQVNRNPNAPAATNVKPKYGSTRPPSNLGGVITNEFDNKQQDTSASFDEQDCWKTCAEDSSVMYWILATAVAAIFALTFMIAGIIMIFKYYRMPGEKDIIPSAQYIPTLHTGEEIYVEVESKRCRDKSMYMSLEKPPLRKPELLSFPPPGEM